ncbi:hypothetical protein HYR54_12495 [Candidatus Acetothermia bacterium]|nr:hypothetical protein [Candidatus Acetothermia bacterium]MBI3460568.1 hypothetical protein [Candidatus Acetothermia bacterium]MBI3661312.1 hypothetical protein [Candidatus Acetothermia bacterium]
MAKSHEALKYSLRLRASQLAERINDHALAERLGKKPWFDTPHDLEKAEKELEEILAQLKELESTSLKRPGHNRRVNRRAKALSA